MKVDLVTPGSSLPRVGAPARDAHRSAGTDLTTQPAQP
jgi:hypothetical protein